NACTTTGPIPPTSFSRPRTPTCGEARPATPTTSRGMPTARRTLTSSWYATARTSRESSSASSSGPSASVPWKGRFKIPLRPSKLATPAGNPPPEEGHESHLRCVRQRPAAANDGLLPNGEPKGGSPVASTLIYGSRDAVLTDPAFTTDQAPGLGDWVAGKG